MYTLNEVTLRPLDMADIPALYAWETDLTLSYYAGWIRRTTRSAFQNYWENRILEPPQDLVNLGIEYEERLVGYVQLALIDKEERRAMTGIVLGDPAVWGKGVGSTAVTILCDYAFTVFNLQRVGAECYGFNTRAHRMFLRAGFQHEGILRQYELHNGVRQDLYVFSMLRDEFYQQHASIFTPGR